MRAHAYTHTLIYLYACMEPSLIGPGSRHRAQNSLQNTVIMEFEYLATNILAKTGSISFCHIVATRAQHESKATSPVKRLTSLILVAQMRSLV